MPIDHLRESLQVVLEKYQLLFIVSLRVVEGESDDACLEVKILEHFLLRELINPFFSDQALYREVGPTRVFASLFQQFVSICYLRIVDSSVQNENDFMRA